MFWILSLSYNVRSRCLCQATIHDRHHMGSGLECKENSVPEEAVQTELPGQLQSCCAASLCSAREALQLLLQTFRGAFEEE